MESAAKLRYRALPLIASPLADTDDIHHQRHGVREKTFEKSQIFSLDQQQTPVFRKKEEASPIELFYDLFFVANLTSFTTVHPIDDKQTIMSYIGFFAILWFTWLQVGLFDVRFGVDSVFERVAKLIHFGVMATFAIIGTRFDPSKRGEAYVNMRQMSMVLVVSRVVLVCQYGSVLLWVKRHRKLATPLTIHMAIFATGGILCLGFFFTFAPYSRGHAYIVWYVIIVVEALAVFGVSSFWEGMSFKHTNLNERCGLLTLIILGEGIIVLTKSMNYLVQGENFSRSIVAQVISAILIIYSVYMLYFDQTSQPTSNPAVHHAWALAHFPFHTALVLLMEGTSRFITWRNALEIVDHILTRYSTIWDDNSNSTLALSHQLGNFSTEILKSVNADPVKFNITGYLTDIRYQSDPNSEQVAISAFQVIIVLVNATFKFFKIEAAQTSNATVGGPVSPPSDGNPDPYSDLGSALNVYDLVFVYFFVAAGLTLILMAVLIALNKRSKKYCKGDWAAIGVRGVVGTGLALVAVVKTDYSAEERFLYSPWMVPTVMLGLGVVVLADGVCGWVFCRPVDEVGMEEVMRDETEREVVRVRDGV